MNRTQRDESDQGLVTTAPFYLEATVRELQRRPGNATEIWDHGCYRRVLRTPEGLALVEVQNHGTIDAPDLRYRLREGKATAATLAGIGDTLRRILGLDVDPQPMLRLASAEPALRDTASALRGMRPPRFAGWLETFANVIPFQQVSLDAGIAIEGRLVERFGEHLDYQGQRLYAFPTTTAIAEAAPGAIRDCGFSRRKAEVLQSVAKAIQSGELAEEEIAGLNNANAVRTLTRVFGIGPWSANIILLRGLGRLDVFPPGDVGADRGVRALLGASSNAAITRTIEYLGDQRGYLYFYALGSALLNKGLIQPAPSTEQ